MAILALKRARGIFRQDRQIINALARYSLHFDTGPTAIPCIYPLVQMNSSDSKDVTLFTCFLSRQFASSQGVRLRSQYSVQLLNLDPSCHVDRPKRHHIQLKKSVSSLFPFYIDFCAKSQVHFHIFFMFNWK